jgi:hypothetical protein
VSVHTDVSECLCLSETPTGAFEFFKILSFCDKSDTINSQLIFVGDIIKDKIIELHDFRLKTFVYSEDEAPKYFLRGIASKLNVSGVDLNHKVSIWNCMVLDKIKIVRN